MSLKREDNWYEYRDSDLSMRVPSYIRPKKAKGFFASRSKKDKSEPLLNIAVEFPNEDVTKAVWSTILGAKPTEWMGVTQRIVRRGKAAYLADGLELLISSHGPGNVDVHDYHVLFLTGPRRIHAMFVGRGDLNRFDELCREIVSSIRVSPS